MSPFYGFRPESLIGAILGRSISQTTFRRTVNSLFKIIHYMIRKLKWENGMKYISFSLILKKQG